MCRYEYFKPVIDKPMEEEGADGREGEGTIKSNRSEITNVFSNPVYRGGSAPQGDRESVESAPVSPNENGVLDGPQVDKAVESSSNNFEDGVAVDADEADDINNGLFVEEDEPSDDGYLATDDNHAFGTSIEVETHSTAGIQLPAQEGCVNDDGSRGYGSDSDSGSDFSV